MDRRRILAAIGCTLAAGPSVQAEAASQPFEMTSISLYLPDQAMRQRGPTAEALGAYIKTVVAESNDLLAKAQNNTGVSGALVIGLKPPARSRLWIVLGDTFRERDLNALLKSRLESVSAPAVRGFQAFAINFNAWGGGRPLAPPLPPIPEEWREVMPRGEILPDGPLRALWPD